MLLIGRIGISMILQHSLSSNKLSKIKKNEQMLICECFDILTLMASWRWIVSANDCNVVPSGAVNFDPDTHSLLVINFMN